VADARKTFEALEVSFAKNFVHEPYTFHADDRAVIDSNARRFLTAMLQRAQRVVDARRQLCLANNADHPASVRYTAVHPLLSAFSPKNTCASARSSRSRKTRKPCGQRDNYVSRSAYI
jgi:hypothetical protein